MGQRRMYMKYFKFMMYLVVVVLVNLAGLTLFFRLDLTENKIYSLSEASREVVSTLSEPLTINVFFTRNLPAPYNTIERYLQDLLKEYAIRANRFFNYRFYDVSPEAEGATETARENQKLADNYGIRPVQIQAFEKDAVKFKKAYMGLVLIHGDLIERLPTISSTDGLEYRLTTAIQKLNDKISALLNLKEKLNVTLILSSSIRQVAPVIGIQQIEDYPEKTRRIVGSLNEKMYGKLDYTYIDPSVSGDSERLSTEYKLMQLRWPAMTDENIPAGSGMVGMVVTYGKKVQEIPILRAIRLPLIGTQYELTPIDRLEETIGEAIETLIDINEDLGYLENHGTLSISARPESGRQQSDGLSSFSSLVSQRYSLKPVRLAEGGIPESLRCLVIVRPTQPFTDYELFEIDQALMRGTSLAVIVDAFKQEMPGAQQPFGAPPGPGFVPLDTGLGKLLEHYGLRIAPAIVMDEHCLSQALPRQMGGGEVPVYYVPIIQNQNINQKLDFMENIRGLIGIRMSPVWTIADRISQNGLVAHTLFSSSEKSWEMRDRIQLNPMFLSLPPEGTERKRYPLAHLLEGEFPSYFDGKPIPEKPVDTPRTAPAEGVKTPDTPAGAPPKGQPETQVKKIEKKGDVIRKGRPAKLFVMASADMLSDSVMDPEGKTPNTVFVLNVLDALNGREQIAVMRSKQQRFNPLRESASSTKTLVKAVNVAGLPILVVMFGVCVWWRRHMRKKQIQRMFQQQTGGGI